MKYKCVIFDLDGTIYFGNKLADRANEVISLAKVKFGQVFFVTNNSAKTREQILKKLINLGIDVKLEELITSSYAIAKYLKINGFKDVYCIGTKSLKSEIEQNEINPRSNSPQAIVVGYDPEFKLSDLNELSNINLSKYQLVVANKERNYPKENGYLVPGAGPIVSAVEALLDKKSDVIVGKPNIQILKIILSELSIKPEEILIIGDSLKSDIQMAKNYGSQGILISKEKINDCECIERLSDLLEIWND